MVGIDSEESMAVSFSRDLLPPLAIQIMIITGSGIHSYLSALRGLGTELYVCPGKGGRCMGGEAVRMYVGLVATAAKLVLVDTPRSHSSSQVRSVFDSCEAL